MLRSLVKTCLRYRFVVLIGAVGLIVFGVLTTMRTPLDVFPEFAPPRVEIQTEAPGMSSEAVESLISIPLENAVNGIPDMTVLRSKSVQGLSSVMMLFKPGTDLVKVRQMVTEKVAVAAASLPQQVKAPGPRVMPPLSSTSRVLHIGLAPKPKEKLKPGEKELTQVDVSVLNRWVISPRLLAIPGVANISTYGHYDKRYHVYVKPRDLRDHGVTLQQIKLALKDSVVYGAAGYHVTPNQQLAVNYVTTIDRPADLGQIVVAHVKGQPVYLGQVATLEAGKPQDVGEGVINDRPGLFLVVEKDPAANTLKVTHEVEKVLASLAPGLPGVEITPDPLRPQTEAEDNICIFRPATFIAQALDNLQVAMVIGCVLVSLILLAFLLGWRAALVSVPAVLLTLAATWAVMQALHISPSYHPAILLAAVALAAIALAFFFFEWRVALISLTAIPLSILTAIVVLHEFGAILNTMVLAGLAIAIGEVVDDAIIDVENIVRRLRQNQELGHPRSTFRVVLDASLEVRSAVVYASFIVVFVCLPIFFLGGVAGSFFKPLALAYILAVMASLGVALVVTPALCYILLPGKLEKHGQPPLVHFIRGAYRGVLRLALKTGWVTALCLLLVLGAWAVVRFVRLKEEYLPQFQETDFLMHWVAKPGTNIDVLRKDICNISKEMRQETAVKAFGSHIARAAELGEEVYGPNFSELWVSFGDFKGDYKAARHKVEEVMARHPGFQHDLLTYLQERIKEVLTGTGATIVLRIFGPELDGLRQEAARVKNAIERGGPEGTQVAGVADLKVEAQVLIPQLELKIDAYRCARHGLKPADVAGALDTLVGGTKVAEVHQDQKVFDVIVWGHPEVRRTYQDLKRLDIDLPGGKGTVPLHAVADLHIISAQNSIRHEKASRCIDVTCNIKDRDLGSVVQDIKKRVDALPGREGYHVEFLGEYQARQENQRQLMLVGLLSLVGIGVLLYIDFRSLRLTLLVFLTLPFALIGGIAAAYFTGGVLSLGSLVGFITVLGIAARNGIMLVSHYRHLQTEEGVPFGRELILRGAEERVAPILMTALAAGLGLLPLAISGSKPGYEVEYPMAVVILGGLFTSTLLNLLVLPVLYERFGSVAVTAADEEDDGPEGKVVAVLRPQHAVRALGQGAQS